MFTPTACRGCSSVQVVSSTIRWIQTACKEGVPATNTPPRRLVKSVSEYHVMHCQRLAGAFSDPASKRTANEVDWDRAALKACKLAEAMKPSDLAACTTAFADGRKRDIRVMYVLGEEAIARRKSFTPTEVALMLTAYARLGVRNEPLFEALSLQLLPNLQTTDIDADNTVKPVEHNTVKPVDSGRAAAEISNEVLQQVVDAHERLSLHALHAYRGIRRLLIDRNSKTERLTCEHGP